MQADKTWLFVPAKEKYIGKIGSIEADSIIMDLEDSLREEQKDDGLRLTAKVIKQYGKSRDIFVRVNSNERLKEELQFLAPYSFSGYMIPKFEETGIVEQYYEEIKGKEVIALIESTAGVVGLEKIAGHPLIHKLAFGGEDFCRELGYAAGEEATFYARNKLVLYASYYKKYSLDTISLEIWDMERFLLSYQKSKRMGFGGKLLIHPEQVKAVCHYNKMVDKEHLQYIVEEYKKSTEGIVRIEGQLYEKPHIDRIESYLHSLEEGEL